MNTVLRIMFLLLISSAHVKSVTPTNSGTTTESPVTFIKNQGQWLSDIIYKGSYTGTTSVSLLRDGISFCNAGEEIENPDGSEVHTFLVWNLRFLNTLSGSAIKGENKVESKLSYLFGNDPSDWVVHPDEYSAITYNDIYTDIDLKLYGAQYDLKYDFIVHPGGDLSSIRAAYEGIEELTINPAGELEVKTQWNNQTQRIPVAWQIINGKKVSVGVQYVLLNDSTFGFIASRGYDQQYDLVIDPLFQMAWASYTNIPGGSNNINYCFANEMDKDGNVYLTGMVDGTFPTTPGAYSGPGNIFPDIFVAKFSSDGSTILYGTYLPGSSSEFGTDIAIDDQGRAYVTGVIDLNITGLTNFPSTPNAFQPVHGGGSDAFITVLNPTGTGLVYSSFIGGTGGETGYGITLGGNGIAYVTGNTTVANFPVVASQTFPSGTNNVFVTKFDINQSGSNSVVYSTTIGGGNNSLCDGRSIDVNSAGNVFITGSVFNNSGTVTYPTSPGAYNNTFNGGIENRMAFVTKLSSTLPVSISYSTWIGPGTGNAITVDKTTEEVFVVGTTLTTTFPVTPGALQPVHALMSDAFVAKLNAAGSNLLYSTFLGGDWTDVGTGLAINSAGEAYISGITQDLFPTSPGAMQPNNAGSYDFFVVNLNATGTGYACGGSTYVGGSDADYSGSFYDFPSPKISIIDHGGMNDTILISSTSHSQDFPTTPGTYGPVKINGIADQPVFFKMTCQSPGAIPVTQITASDFSLCDDGTVDFTDQSMNNPTSWNWYFPGAITSSSTLQNPTGIVYTNQGTYSVTLVACNSFGCDSTVFANYIAVYPGPSIPFLSTSADTIFSTPAFAYQWYSGTTPLPADTNQYFIPPQDGVYYVMIFDSLGCSAVSKSTTITDIANPSEQLSDITIFPNPLRGNTTIHINSLTTKNISVNLIDVSGKLVTGIYNGKISPGDNNLSFDASQISKGIYFIEVISGEEVRREKVEK